MQHITEIIEFIRTSIPETFKEASGCLRHPYLSPGGPYARSLWDWDSCWTIFAILEFAAKNSDVMLKKQLAAYARGTWFNFLEHQGTDGAIPILIEPEDEDPFDCLKSADNNMAKPFIAQLGRILLKHDLISPDEAAARLKKIRSFHQCYRERYLHAATGLVFWAKDWGIGDDDDPAIWGRPEKSCASLFLNVFLYQDYLAAASIASGCGYAQYAAEYQSLADQLAGAIQKYCWDEREKSFFSVDIQCRANLSEHRIWGTLNKNLDTFWHALKLKILSWNSILPFWAGIGTKEQFDQFARENLIADRLWSPHGIRTVSYDEPMYAPEIMRGNPSNWLGPVWIISNFIAWETVKRYGYHELEQHIASATLKLLANDLHKNGMFHEYYSPESGVPVGGGNFMSWNSLALLLI